MIVSITSCVLKVRGEEWFMFINVPQGYSARLIADDCTHFDIKGLYTEGFSTCNIVICVGNNRIVLFHVDAKMIYDFPKIKKEIDWVDEPNQLIVLARGTSPLRDRLSQLIAKDFPEKKLQWKTVGEEHDGVSVSFAKSPHNQLHFQVSLYLPETRPANLCRHPEEKRLLAVQKIEQFVGAISRARKGVEGFKQGRQCHLFDGKSWEFLDKKHLEIDAPDAETKKEISSFNKNDTIAQTAAKLKVIIDVIEENLGFLEDPDTASRHTAEQFENYFNNFTNHGQLFRRNLMDSLDFIWKGCQKKTEDIDRRDICVIEDLYRLLNLEEDVFKKVKSVIEAYESAPGITKFKRFMLVDYRAAAKHYERRQFYAELDTANENLLQKNKQLASRAAVCFKEKDFVSAANFFEGILKNIRGSCTKDSSDLASSYHNLGRSLQQLGHFVKAEKCLSYSLVLKSNFTNPKPIPLEIEKTQKALIDCQKQLRLQADNATDQAQSRVYTCSP